MSLLWKCEKNRKMKIKIKEPSPKYRDHILGLAQGSKNIFSIKSPKQTINCNSIKGISLFSSITAKICGSMTVEAAVVLPLFLFFFLNMGCAIEMIRLHGNLEVALWEIGNRVSVYQHVLSDEEVSREELLETSEESEEMRGGSWREDLAGIGLGYLYIGWNVIDYLGEDYLNASPMTYGAAGLNFLESTVQEMEDCIEIVATYEVSPFVEMVGFHSFRMANKYYAHIWNGYRIPGTEGREAVVYITENGTVYHTDRGCTHLTLSIDYVSWQEACESRNGQGQRYDACEKCCEEEREQNVYITAEGECYHYRRDCSGLKRTVIAIPVSEINGLPICSRCMGE